MLKEISRDRFIFCSRMDMGSKRRDRAMSGEIIYLDDFRRERRSPGPAKQPQTRHDNPIASRKRLLRLQVARIDRLLEELKELDWSPARPGTAVQGRPKTKMPRRATGFQVTSAERPAVTTEDPQPDI